MTQTIMLRCALSGQDPLAIAVAVLAKLGSSDIPREVVLDMESVPTKAGWLAEYAPLMRTTLASYWQNGDRISINKSASIVKVQRAEYGLDPRALVELLSEIPFALGSFMALQEDWSAAEPWKSYNAPGFADQHYEHGWACAFRGDGHTRLVSSRWLDYGPWRTLRAGNDTTLVQFHALDQDAPGALAQARPGHARMGISERGGFLSSRYRMRPGTVSTYSEAQRSLISVVAGREIPSVELRDLAAARHYQTLGPERPIDEVRVVFVEEEVARRHLHELWLYGHRCFVADGSGERSIDASYVPPSPEKPDWVQSIGSEAPSKS